MSGPLDVLRCWVPQDHLPDCGLGRNRHFCDCDYEERRAALAAVEQRLALADAMEAAIKSARLRLDNLGLALAAWCPHGFDSSRAGDYGWADQFTRELEEALAALARFQAGSPADTKEEG